MNPQVWTSLEEASGPCVVSVGTFDGVHRGHRVVVQTARAVADRIGLPLVVLTFDPHPMSVVRPGTQPPAVATVRHRVELLGRSGADAVLVLPFDSSVAALSADEFIDLVLVHALDAHAVVVGDDFRFGHRAGGDVALLRDRGAERGFEVVAVAPVGHQGVRWSSTEVRRRVGAGDVAGAADVLGHLFEVEGPVGRGDQRGRALGYPTANLAVAPGMLVPADGVYAGYLRRLDAPLHVMPAAVSVGTNPTFDGSTRRVEAYVLDGDAIDGDTLDLYGVEVAISFVARLRGQQRFDDVPGLVAQMALDVARTREALEAVDASALSARWPT
jgi:riboflavin kinase/FMN adenylyltransferase